MMTSPLTPLDFLARSALVYGDRTAVVDGDRRFTYAEFQARVHRLAGALHQLGVVPGDRVAVLAPNTVLALEAHFGPMLIGAILVMLNTRLQSGELAWILNHCGAKVLLVDPLLRPLVESASTPHIVSDYEGFLGRSDADFRPAPLAIDENACVAINYTSGTTGFPKGVMCAHRAAWTNAIAQIIEHGLT